MKLFGTVIIQIILYLVHVALSAKSHVISMSLKLWKNALYFWSFYHIAHLNFKYI